jgi:hypothetical protein
MRPLSEQELLQVWETGLGQHPLDQALTLLAAGLPGVSRAKLAALSIGQRDGYLLALRERIFGPHLAGQARCPACQEQVEFSFNTADIRLAPPLEAAEEQRLITEGYELHFRLPNSLDLAALLDCVDVETARRWLAERCLIQVHWAGADAPVVALSETAINALARQMTYLDPQAEIKLALTCPGCGQNWSVLFDIVTFFWAELTARARRLLREVHALAQTYGWREADILAMSPVRRRSYLEMLGY